jgi:branched-chain amino acid aminotransferase
MTRLVMLDGRLVDEAHATVSVFDRGFLYGDSVFETVRTYAGLPFELDEHLNRLAWSAERVFIPIPIQLPQFKAEVEQTVTAAANPESYIRVMVTRGTGAMGLDPSATQNPMRIIIVDKLTPPDGAAYRDGIRTITFKTQRFGDSTAAAGAKVANYLVAVLAMREAREAGASEALITDHTGKIVEGSTSNVFAVQGELLLTPPESAGILPGITRRRVLRAAAELGVGVEYRAFDASRITSFDELFVCSSIRELLPVVYVDGRPVGAGLPGPTTLRLLQRFRENVQQDMGLRYPFPG